MDLGPEDVLLLISRDSEKTARRLSEVRARREECARKKVAEDASRMLRGANARFRRAERTEDPTEAARLPLEGEERLKDLANVDPSAWLWAKWIYAIRGHDLLIPAGGEAPVHEGLRVGVPSPWNPDKIQFVECGRVVGTMMGLRAAGSATWTEKTMEWVAAQGILPEHFDPDWLDTEDVAALVAADKRIGLALRCGGNWTSLGWTLACSVLRDAERGQDPTGAVVTLLTPDVRAALERADAGAVDGSDTRVLATALDRAADLATGAGGGGLVQVATIAARGQAALDALTPSWLPADERPPRRNPFGRLAGLRISKKNYDRRRAWRFRKSFHRWMPPLNAWDATLRLIAAEARIRRRFKPGFVLDDELISLTTTTPSGSAVVYLHPDRFEQVIKAHRERPLAIAAYLQGVACHELTHLDGRMGEGHSEAFVAAREDLGHATGHLLPALAVLVQRVLGLPVKPTEDQRRIATLERQLARAREARGDDRKARARVERLERELAEVRAALAEAEAEGVAVREASDRRCGT